MAQQTTSKGTAAIVLLCPTDPLPQGILDPLVVKCVAYLNRESVLVEQGLFRVPGDVAAIKKLRASFISGEESNLLSGRE